MRRTLTAAAAVVLIAGLPAVPAPATGSQAVDTPTVRGPIGETGLWGHALWDSWFDMSDVGYTNDEFFVSGTARSLGGATAPYTTRIIVSRPTDPAGFNGTVLIDWVNVTAQFENAVTSITSYEMLIREGYAFVHASVQAAGICCVPFTPKIWDPVRYAGLDHPGDDYMHDILSQIARSMRSRQGTDPMGGLEAQTVLAAGQSQSAIHLYTYVAQVQPEAGVIDGFLIHGGGSKQYEDPPQVPVIHLLSDFEASPSSPNTDVNYRLWEVAGAAHSDFWIGYHSVFGHGPRVLAHHPQRPASDATRMARVAGNYGEHPHPLHAACVLAGGTFPMRYASNAAIHNLNHWVRTGEPPRQGPRYRFDGNALARDAHGNALGGIRLPPVEVPVATYVSDLCLLGGITVPFTPLQLRQLYTDHADYYSRMVEATRASLQDGFMLEADAVDLLQRACRAQVPNWVMTSSTCDRGDAR